MPNRGHSLTYALTCGALLSAPGAALAQSVLIVDGETQTLSGQQRYDHICVLNGGALLVDRYAGGPKDQLGNLELLASTIHVDATSSVSARGRGYQARQCMDGAGPSDVAGGRGGCSVWDSGGGGAHFGGGGRGTVDLQGVLHGEVSFEDDCDIDFTPDGPNPTPSTGAGGTCEDTRVVCGEAMMSCPDGRGGRFCRIGPSVAGIEYWHNVYDPEFGAAGGDKGCNDGDGANNGNPIVGGHGGGRVVIAGLSHLGDGSDSPCGAGLSPGQVRFDGTLDAGGTRGCGHGNDSGGGGAGGTVLVVGQDVAIGGGARLSAAGGLGGDTFAKDVDPHGDCASNSQDPGSTCDDCGGGGGGGIISVLSADSTIDPGAEFDVSGAPGGTCNLCQGEAGGGAGELQLDGAYVGEFCDGFDNDFDGEIDEGLGTLTCGHGSCAMSIPACTAGVPTTCSPATGIDESCNSSVDGARARIAIVLDSSASMLLDLAGNPTFGDGSVEHPGLSTDGDGQPNDSRMFLAREAVAQVVSAYPEIDFGLARYHQDQGLLRACQTARWFECQDLVASYDDPSDNAGAVACTKDWGNAVGSLDIRQDPSPTNDEECIHYAGSCGPPRRGADVLSGFGTRAVDLVRWLDGRETHFIDDATPGNVCDHAGGGDCELRATGPTPLAGSLLAMEDYIVPIRATDPAVACRGYSVILVTDGAESCNGDPASAAARLHDMFGIEVYVIAVSVQPDELVSLDEIASSGSGSERNAIPVNSSQALVTSLTEIVAASIRSETCNGMDDDCDGAVDEDFPALASACDDGLLGVCRGEGSRVCNTAGDGTECSITMPGGTAEAERCNGLDDDCDERLDEGLSCHDTSCEPTGDEVCDGDDDDCDGNVDETDPALGNSCGETAGECEPGRIVCAGGMLQCLGQREPEDEVCDGDDDDCDGEIDNDAPCPNGGACHDGSCRRSCDPDLEFPCPFGMECMGLPAAEGSFCVPSVCATCRSDERCVDDRCVDLCAEVTCEGAARCEGGRCLDCHTFGCGEGQLCAAGQCRPDACLLSSCGADEMCIDGACHSVCEDTGCGDGSRCGQSGECQADPCANITCEADEFCDNGECRDNICSAMRCPLNNVCVPALGCVGDPCALVSCPGDRTCVVTDRGMPQCMSNTVQAPEGEQEASERNTPQRYVSLGGANNFDCAVGGPVSGRGGGGPVWPLLAAAWGLRRLPVRRRRSTL
ncbi:MAG: VWA domain-containing protein [Myxococcales bacterium]|nr:VWA domain-containing protein [Myxococcales bacterium]